MHLLQFKTNDQEVIQTICNPTMKPQVGDIVEWQTYRGPKVGNVQRVGVVHSIKWNIITERIIGCVEERIENA